MRRLDRARIVRDQILKLAAEHGAWEECGDVKSLAVRMNGWHASLHSPFNPITDALPEAASYLQAVILQQAPAPLPYQLDLWVAGTGKVLAVEWRDSELRIISMRRGAWEQELFGLPQT